MMYFPSSVEERFLDLTRQSSLVIDLLGYWFPLRENDVFSFLSGRKILRSDTAIQFSNRFTCLTDGETLWGMY